jgi:hypothetical protein
MCLQASAVHRAGIISRRPEGANAIYTLTDESAVAILRVTLASVQQQLRELAELAQDPMTSELAPPPRLPDGRASSGPR